MPRPKSSGPKSSYNYDDNESSYDSDYSGEDGLHWMWGVVLFIIVGLFLVILFFLFVISAIIILGVVTFLLIWGIYNDWDPLYFIITGIIILIIGIGGMVVGLLPIWSSFPSELTWDAFGIVWPMSRIKIVTWVTGSGLVLFGLIKIIYGAVENSRW